MPKRRTAASSYSSRIPPLRPRSADDGCGFDPATSRTTWQTFGLLGIEERVAILGGTLRIDSQEGRGTKIYLTVPTPPVQR